MPIMRGRKAAIGAVAVAATLFTATVAVPALGGPQALSAASLAAKVKKALKKSKKANKRSKVAKATAEEALAKAEAALAKAEAALAKASAGGGTPGPAGPTGPKGDKGDPGADATTLWAVVDDSGNLSRGRGVVDVLHTGTGENHVQFDQHIDTCSWSATIGFESTMFSGVTGLDRGFITSKLASDAGITFRDMVTVETFDPANAAADRPFHLQVFC